MFSSLAQHKISSRSCDECLSWNRALFEAGCEEYPWLVEDIQHLCEGAGKWVWSVGSVPKGPTDPTLQFLHDRC